MDKWLCHYDDKTLKMISTTDEISVNWTAVSLILQMLSHKYIH